MVEVTPALSMKKTQRDIVSRMYKYVFGLMVVKVILALSIQKYDMNLTHS